MKFDLTFYINELLEDCRIDVNKKCIMVIDRKTNAFMDYYLEDSFNEEKIFYIDETYNHTYVFSAFCNLIAIDLIKNNKYSITGVFAVAARNILKITQCEIAKNLNVSMRTVQSWELGINIMKIDDFINLKNLLNIDNEIYISTYEMLQDLFNKN